MVAEAEGDAGVDHRLALEYIQEELYRNVDVGKHIQIRLPTEPRPCFFAAPRGLLKTADIFTLFKVKAVLKAVAMDQGVKILGSILCGTGAQAVETQGVLIIVSLQVVVLAAGIEFAENQLPVELLLFFVPVHRAAPAEVLHFDGLVLVAGDGDGVSMAFAGLINGVAENFKNGVLAALQAVGPEDDSGPFPDPVRPFEGGDRVVAILLLASAFGHWTSLTFQYLYGIILVYPISGSCVKEGDAI